MSATQTNPGSLVCRESGQRFATSLPIWRSPATGGLLDLDWPSTFPIEQIVRREISMWRYREAIPIARDDDIVTLGECVTPLIPWRHNGHSVLLKLETRFASGSYKDRGAAVMVSQCKALGLKRVVEDSSGNAGAAVAMYCARAGLGCDIYVPESTAPEKLVQAEASGARMVRVPGSRQDTSEAVWKAAETTYYASHSWNPFFFHGTKTFAFEVAEQLGWRAPGTVVIPTGNGTLLLGAWIGFQELARAGVIDRVPRLIAVQARACAPLLACEERGESTVAPVTAGSTIAEGVAIANPVRGAQCVECVRASGGRVVGVTDEQTIAALRVCLQAGMFIEPTSAVAMAALDHLGDLETGPGREVVVAITGHGLKSVEKIRRLLRTDPH